MLEGAVHVSSGNTFQVFLECAYPHAMRHCADNSVAQITLCLVQLTEVADVLSHHVRLQLAPLGSAYARFFCWNFFQRSASDSELG